MTELRSMAPSLKFTLEAPKMQVQKRMALLTPADWRVATESPVQHTSPTAK